ncbi:ribonuclease J [Patescibacteria group bacterium AH-259-L07]|nr:ribonuclease J [Patescibacteria group bacterium AH-259-L07]
MKTTLRIIPLGGVEEVGINCTVFEYGQDIIVIDLGFGFSGSDLPGVGWLLPDVSYLEKHKNRIRGIVITHGHLDHIGGLSYLITRLGSPPIFATKLSCAYIKDRFREAGVRGIEIHTIEAPKQFSLGSFTITPFHVVHNIPDSVGFAIATPVGTIIHTGDFKFDDNPADQKAVDKKALRRFGRDGVLACLSDSTNAEEAGHTPSEREVSKIIKGIIRHARGRVIFTSFSTLISRIGQVIFICQKYNRKIAIAGFSIKKSVKIAHALGCLTVPDKLFIDLKSISSCVDKNLLILAAGTQGEERSAMTRIARGQHHLIKIKQGDTVVFSSSAIPGNELAIHKIMNGLIDQGAEIMYEPVLGMGVHSSGHAYRDELLEMLQLVRPHILIPIHGEHYMHAQHRELAQRAGIKRERCFILKNGNVLEIDEKKQARVAPKKVVSAPLVVEGGKIRILKQDIVKMRQRMAESGVCIISVSRAKKKQGKTIEVMFLGLFVDKNKIFETRNKVQKLIQRYGLSKTSKIKIESRLSDFLLNKIGKKPLVIIV